MPPFVIVVGAGPSGLLLTLLLGQKGIPVQLLEASDKLDDRPRATHYAAPAMYELRRAGIVEDMKASGAFVPDGACFRKLDGEYLTGMPAQDPGSPDSIVCLPLNKLNEILEIHIAKLSHVEILYGHRVTGLGQDENKAWVDVETPDGVQVFEAPYIVGCDGASSQVRRCLFGDEFPGFTWDQQIVATNTYYPFKEHGFTQDSNFIIHPEHWYMAARISNDGLWRVTYGEISGLSYDELKARQPEKFRIMLPGHPEPDQYNMISFSPYKVHQRIVEKMRVGRVLLAADAAHLCNPFGGLGLTGGIVDVGGLFDCLAGIYEDKADDSILDIYDNVRRAKYNDMVNPISSANIQLLFEQNPDTAVEENEFLGLCEKAKTDENISQMFRTGMNALRYDFTQHYRYICSGID